MAYKDAFLYVTDFKKLFQDADIGLNNLKHHVSESDLPEFVKQYRAGLNKERGPLAWVSCIASEWGLFVLMHWTLEACRFASRRR